VKTTYNHLEEPEHELKLHALMQGLVLALFEFISVPLALISIASAAVESFLRKI